MELTSRDVAAVILIALLALFLWRQHALGGTARSFLRILLSRILIEVALLTLAWAVLLVFVAEHFGLWEPRMLHDTVLALVPAGSLLVGATSAASKDGWYRKQLRRALKLGVAVEVFVGLTTFDLAVEVALLIVLLLAGGLVAVAGTRYDTSGGRVPRFAQRVQIVGGLILIGGPILYVAQHFGSIDWRHFALDAFQPIWLTVFTLPLASYVSLVCAHEDAQNRLGWSAKGKARWYQRLALIVGLHVRARALSRFTYSTQGMRDLAEATGLRAAIAVVRRPVPPVPNLTDPDDDDADDVPALSGGLDVSVAAPVTVRRRRRKQHGKRRSR